MSSQSSDAALLRAIGAQVEVGHHNGHSTPELGSGVQLAAIAYTRVSTADQALGFSLEDQTAKLVAEGFRRDWAMRVMAEAQSAKDDRRPVLQDALAMLAAGDAVALLVTRLDRLTRSTSDFYMLMDLAAKQGWALVCLEPAVDMTSPFGRAMGGMAAVFAQLERELIAQRQRDSVQIRKAKGIYANNKPLVDAEVAAMVCQMRRDGQSYARISETLIQAGHRPPKGGQKWNHPLLSRICEREAR